MTAHPSSASPPDRTQPVYGWQGRLWWAGKFFARAARPPLAAMLSARAQMIRRQRPDLRAAFDLDTVSGRIGLFEWYVLHGYREMALPPDRDGPKLLEIVNTPVRHIKRHTPVPITWLMVKLRERSGMSFPPLRTQAGQQQLIRWYFLRGLTQFYLEEFLSAEQAAYLLEPERPFDGVPRILAFVWEDDEAASARFSSPASPGFRQWCLEEGVYRYAIIGHPLLGLTPKPRARPSRSRALFGVNLIGHAFGRSGISEDMRMAAKCLKDSGVPFVIHDVSRQSPAEGGDMIDARLSHDLPYDINLFCMPAMATVAAAVDDPRLADDRRYRIGFWPWELPEWPAFWSHAYSYVDEIWAASGFTYAAYCRSSPVPVRHVPMAVAVEEGDGLDRGHFGLPVSDFLFLHAFDGLSTFSRKNPGAAIDAFHKAFGPSCQNVGLVIKGQHVAGASEWVHIETEARADPRIRIVTQSLTRSALLDLYRATDAFVSLHRSEGFGRNIAEMMAIRKPVIVSAHSGNMDFTNADNAALVPVRLEQVKDGDYPFGAGQNWAAPDIECAAICMKRLFQDREAASGLAAIAERDVNKRYNFVTVGKVWRQLLDDLWAGSSFFRGQ